MQSYAHFHTEERECPYLHDRPSRLEVRLIDQLSSAEHSLLLQSGVRHFGRSYFRASCRTCSECLSLRVPGRTFRPSRSQRRTIAKNRDIEVSVGDPRVDADRIDLYRRFHTEREAKRGWVPSHIDMEEYVASFVDSPVKTIEFRYSLGGRLVAVAYVDDSTNAFNSIFAFWEPALFRRGLGTFDVLTEIREAQRRGKEFLYLGYYVKGCVSLEYKRTFRPCELLKEGRWMADEAEPVGPPMEGPS